MLEIKGNIFIFIAFISFSSLYQSSFLMMYYEKIKSGHKNWPTKAFLRKIKYRNMHIFSDSLH
jgi:hypothetical protein